MSVPRTCFYCGKRLTQKTATSDHKHPLCLGGRDIKRNRVDCCRRCNLRKGCLTYEEFRVVTAFALGLIKSPKFKFYGETHYDQ